jgi:Ca-activated chloride channel homolog
MACARRVAVVATVLMSAVVTHTAAESLGAEAACEPAMLVFDATGSMKGTRISQAREAAHRIIPPLAAKRAVGLTTYGAMAETEACSSVRIRRMPAVTDGAAILADIDALQPDGRTPLTEAVATASRVLTRIAKAATIVLLTDGEENCRGDPCALGHELAGQPTRITVHVIGFRLRVEEGSALACLANATGGHFVEASDAETLAAALDTALGCAPVAFERLPTGSRPTYAALRPD